MDPTAVYAIVHASMTGIVIAPLLILGLCLLCLGRRRGDPARTGVTWLKVAFPITTL